MPEPQTQACLRVPRKRLGSGRQKSIQRLEVVAKSQSRDLPVVAKSQSPLKAQVFKSQTRAYVRCENVLPLSTVWRGNPRVCELDKARSCVFLRYAIGFSDSVIWMSGLVRFPSLGLVFRDYNRVQGLRGRVWMSRAGLEIMVYG